MRQLHRQTYIKIALFLMCYPLSIKGQDTLFYTSQQSLIDIGQYARFYQDQDHTLSFDQIQTLPDSLYKKSETKVMNFDNTTASIWLKLIVKNQTEYPLLLSFDNNELQYIDVFTINEANQLTHKKGGTLVPFIHRYLQRGSTVLSVGQSPKTIFINIKSHSSIYMPLTISSMLTLSNANYKRDVFSGFCMGIMIGMAFYNFFIFFLVKERLYFYYFVLGLISVSTISQLNGLGPFFIWQDTPYINCINDGELLSIMSAIFTIRFLNTREKLPKGHKLLLVFIGLQVVCLAGCFIDIQPLSNIVFQLLTSLESVTVLTLGIIAYRQGNKSAKYYILGWSFLVLGAIITLLSFSGVLPFNDFTLNAFVTGSCLENLLLSFALANRINIYRDESAKSQALVLQHLQENERLIKEQNKVLEDKVKERTHALENTLNQLKSTESQLVQSEKMAALGELTAGIAHEINNPINFISSSIPPLKRDIEALDDLINKYDNLNSDNLQAKLQEISDFKEEIDYDYTKEEIALLLSSIADGTNRTTEIVKGLRNFARLDEADQKRSSINEGLESTILLMQSSFKKKNIQLIKELGDIPNIICYPGQLNQVFMNILNNSVQAMSEKGTITIKTRFCPETDSIKIGLSDTGVGMSEAVKNKIFQPFFTTKDVGEGTGLGLSISYGIVKKHNGTIEVESEEGKGTTFWITLPKGEKLVKE